ELVGFAKLVAEETSEILEKEGLLHGPLFQSNATRTRLKTLSTTQERLLIKNSISPLPLHKVLTLLQVLGKNNDPRFDRYARLVLAKQAVYSISNLRFGPEIGVGKIKDDSPVLDLWLKGIRDMASDLKQIQHLRQVPSTVHRGDARKASSLIAPGTI